MTNKKVLAMFFAVAILSIIYCLAKPYSFLRSSEYGLAIQQETLNQILESELDMLQLRFTEERYINDYAIKTINYHLNFDSIAESGKRYLLNLDIHYPQISGIADGEIENKINNLLKYIPIESINNASYQETIKYFQSIVNMQDVYPITSINNSYQIRLLNDKYISISYKGDAFFGRNVTDFEYSATIDLESGHLLFLEDIINIDTLIHLIKNKKYEVIAGYYGEQFDYSSEMNQGAKFADIIKDSSYYKVNHDTYDKFSSSNFSIDEEFLYINLRYENALHGYVILKVNYPYTYE